ncbi:MAG: BlaI/MecI/CopY family transcriptional regulator [Bacteroidales bacterium]|jgi:predicted transcriptional regulator|nr:BlaI/MecI/CopY family transcriptional regulator [Bacteroidales bacterium]MDD2322778.1 BlaI/MecI/CopY family transcriptional regulator [Bacteroidales bacterium]MDD3961087.1 BlaI/MecI/CopY family transcriptional regulator [Bacteroidales bacterium]MDY0284809.1 BlaI/MecI/CopY family transcriptional regulator [Bacteroidales bacterium]HPE87153.1 BlaI/MecI/CopY family transcriptional regulator [Bacteroidales bacterium]
MKELTKAEEQVMQILWEINEGVIHDIIARIEDPKPAYNTISTIVRILESKGFIDHTAVGRTHFYYPLIEKEEYSRRYFKSFLSRYFKGSFAKLTSAFTESENLSIQEMEEIRKLIDKTLKAQRKEHA